MATPVKVFGSENGSSLVLYKGYPVAKRISNSWEVVYKYWCRLEVVETLIPSAFATCPHPNHGTLTLQETEYVENGKPGLCDVILTYRYKSVNYHVNAQAGDSQKSASAVFDEIPLDDDRLVTTGILSAAQVKVLRKRGYITWHTAAVEYTLTEWSSSWTWSQANIIANIGDEQDPDGLSSPTAGKWALVSRTVRSDGDLIEQTRTWRYSAVGWKD